jgi:hypothetical protein
VSRATGDTLLAAVCSKLLGLEWSAGAGAFTFGLLCFLYWLGDPDRSRA